MGLNTSPLCRFGLGDVLGSAHSASPLPSPVRRAPSSCEVPSWQFSARSGDGMTLPREVIFHLFLCSDSQIFFVPRLLKLPKWTLRSPRAVLFMIAVHSLMFSGVWGLTRGPGLGRCPSRPHPSPPETHVGPARTQAGPSLLVRLCAREVIRQSQTDPRPGRRGPLTQERGADSLLPGFL